MAEFEVVDREFSWEDEISNDQSFVLLPEGDYPFEVEGFTRARHPGSVKLPPCNKAELKIRINGPKGSAAVTHNLFLHSKCEGLLCAFFTSIGLRRHGEPLHMRWDIIGKGGTCHVGVRTYTNKSGEERQTNEITRFLDPEEAPRQTAVSAATAAGWQAGRF